VFPGRVPGTFFFRKFFRFWKGGNRRVKRARLGGLLAPPWGWGVGNLPELGTNPWLELTRFLGGIEFQGNRKRFLKSPLTKRVGEFWFPPRELEKRRERVFTDTIGSLFTLGRVGSPT